MPASPQKKQVLLDQLDQEIRRLPSLPSLIVETLAMLGQADLDLAVLADKISQDQTLAARVLRMANSPFYGLARQIGSIRDATVMLGIHTLRHIITAAGVMGQFRGQGDPRFDQAALWRHAIGTGIAAQVVARRQGLDAEVAFTAGLLHDLGKLVLACYFPEAFAEALACRDARDCLLREAEQAVLGFDHTRVGARLASQWKLPPLIVTAIERHHTPDDEPRAPIADVVHVADILCRGLEIGDGGDGLIPRLSPAVMQRLGLDWEALKACLPQIEALNATANLLEVPA